MGDQNNSQSISAKNIPVSLFRQIHHMPLVWCGTGEFSSKWVGEELESEGWNEVQEPLRVLAKGHSSSDDEAFNEIVYFHDFARDFLYPTGASRSFRMFEKQGLGAITVTISDLDKHELQVERITIHLFRTRIAILTVETLHKGGEAPLTLAKVQTLIDYFRRSYTPFWDKKGQPSKVPVSINISGHEFPNSQCQPSMIKFLEGEGNTLTDAPLLEPWKSWIYPLNHKDWRDPSDERVPVMSLILLEKTERTNRDTLNRISDQDWYRLAEADESGSKIAYNPKFLSKMDEQVFYDRFLPDERMEPDLATRQIFGGAHYSVVSVDEEEFSRPILQTHFRRHYEKMALVARFEFATLLAFSSRLTRLVKDLEISASSATARSIFGQGVLEVHRDFLEFTHRYRFTGISCQIQGSEMFERWRASLNLDQMYKDVKDEITSASEYAQAVQADQKTDRGNWLATAAIFVGTALAAPGLAEFSLIKNLVSWLTGCAASYGYPGAAPWIEFVTPFAALGATAAASAMVWFVFKWKRHD